ncbi:hypothetical protein JMJ77_0006007 [Colletotrichum scovillei]|uniref:Uncharacterized protein n=1 Tax=Colletotrichum scovillei TaxID=1209932 RepID=A0A9P7RJE3_9PEZI|nr:hypothetical protein JMJ77_0006007 [Colletotrichum scovillei]KAG7077315.1 hypothetical protein JMJ76_0014563 [Colletotrichum scovillei]KAG7084347.1 hypothetical protein JMJ78_0009784 [Colletotrichum scovillei]
MDTQPNTRIPDTSFPRPQQGRGSFSLALTEDGQTDTTAPTDGLPFGGEGLVRLVRPPGAAFNPMSECGNQLDALSDTEKPATA